MPHHSSFNNDNAGRRPPTAEWLVLEGCRRWTRRDAEAEMLHRAPTPEIIALKAFVETLNRCATCPLHVFETGSRHVGRDENLILGLIAAIQHGDDETAETCLQALTCASRCEQVAVAAATFAFVLRSNGHMLLPISASEIRAVLTGEDEHPAPANACPVMH